MSASRPRRGQRRSVRQAHRDSLRAHLGRKGLKWTRQREAIVEVFLRGHGHFTAEDLYARVARRDASIGFSTLYRTLRLFVDAGIASERRFRDGLARYEVRQAHHDHLVCVACGAIREFERDAIEALQEEVAREHGFRLLSHRHELYGTCPLCSRGKQP